MALDDPWNVDPADYPEDGDPATIFRFLANYAVLAPSGHNAQPWLFRMAGARVEILADRRRALPVVDPRDRELTISCGAALGQLLIALRRFGWAGEVEWLPEGEDSDLLARVGLGEAITPGPEDRALFQAIAERRTTRAPFEPQSLPEEQLGRLAETAHEDGITCRFVTSEREREAVAALIAEGDRAQFSDPAFRRELAAWIHSRRAQSRDGISFAAFGGPDPLSFAGAFAVRTFDMGKSVAAKDREIAEHSPALALLSSAADDARGWLACGLALSRLLLAATAEGLTAAYLNQPIEVEALRGRLGRELSVDGHPQILLRLGKGPRIPPAVRRPVAEVWLSEA